MATKWYTTDNPAIIFEDTPIGRLKKEIWDASDEEIERFLKEDCEVPSPSELGKPGTYIQNTPRSKVIEKRRKNDLVFLPIGCTENHGIHANSGLDTFMVTQILEGVRRYTKKLGCEANLAFPPLNYGGHPYHHMGMPGTVIMPEEVVKETLIYTMLGLWNDGFRKIILVNNHGHLWMLESAIQEFCKRFREFPELGYREFKQKLMNGTLLDGARAVAVGRHDVLLKEDADQMIQRVDALFDDLTILLREALTRNKGKFDESRLRALFEAHQLDVRSAKRFIGQLLESRVEEGRSVSYISSARKKESSELQFTVTRGFELLLQRYRKLMQQYITGSSGQLMCCYCTPFSDLNLLLNLLSMLGSVAFSVEGGGSPCVEIRLLQPQVLEQIAGEGSYRNQVLAEEELHFQQQIELYNHFFGNQQLSDAERWDFIEAYFTGRLSLQESPSVAP